MCTEVAWVEAARDGDREAFGLLVRRFQKPIYNLAYRMLGSALDAEDAAQEVFLKAYRALDAYDRRRPFSTWLLSVAAHHCIDRLRRRRLREVSLEALPFWRWGPADAEDPCQAVEAAERSDRIDRLMAGLPADHRLVLVLRYWHDLGYAEIAAIIGDSESAVKSRLHRARRLVATALEADDARHASTASDGPGESLRPAPSEEVRSWTALLLANR